MAGYVVVGSQWGDEGKGKIDFEIPEILCVVNVDVGVNAVSVNELKLAVTENANEDITAEKEFADSGVGIHSLL